MTSAAPNTNLQRLETLEKLVADQAARIAALEAVIGALRGVFLGGSADAASDRELDAQWGDPDVKIIPRDWTSGGVVKGQKFSRCPPEFLDLLAETMDYFAQRNDAAGAKDGKGRPKSHYDKKNARFARGWARRLRSGWTAPEAPRLTGSNGATPFGGGSGFGGGSPFGGGSGFGTSRSAFGAPTGGFGTSRAPAPPPSEPEPLQKAQSTSEPSPDDLDFPFGANVAPESAPTGDADDDDDLSLDLPAT